MPQPFHFAFFVREPHPRGNAPEVKSFGHPEDVVTA
jgi:hypothetical protein